jgi:hypothetical protein
LIIGDGGKEVKSGYTQVVSVLIIDIVGVFDYCSGFPEIWGMVLTTVKLSPSKYPHLTIPTSLGMLSK